VGGDSRRMPGLANVAFAGPVGLCIGRCE